MKRATAPRPLPGGLAPPAVLLVAAITIFAVTFTRPGLIDVGGVVSIPGLAVMTAVVSAFWLLVAISRTPPRVGDLKE